MATGISQPHAIFTPVSLTLHPPAHWRAAGLQGPSSHRGEGRGVQRSSVCGQAKHRCQNPGAASGHKAAGAPCPGTATQALPGCARSLCGLKGPRTNTQQEVRLGAGGLEPSSPFHSPLISSLRPGLAASFPSPRGQIITIDLHSPEHPLHFRNAFPRLSPRLEPWPCQGGGWARGTVSDGCLPSSALRASFPSTRVLGDRCWHQA